MRVAAAGRKRGALGHVPCRLLLQGTRRVGTRRQAADPGGWQTKAQYAEAPVRLRDDQRRDIIEGCARRLRQIETEKPVGEY